MGGKYRKLLFDIEYTEVDITGEPDLILNLEQDLPIPYQDKQFDTVICTEVLEHVDNLHDVFYELIRLSNRFVIISLPNCLLAYKHYIIKPQYSLANIKFYGLPLKKPLDRHKWFFSYSDIESFVCLNAQTYNYRVVELFGIGLYTSNLFGKLKRYAVQLIKNDEAVKNLFCKCLWCVLDVKQLKIDTGKNR